MELQQIKQMFEEKESQIIEEVSEVTKEIMRRELALTEFELSLAAIPRERREKAEKAVQELRAERWADALEKAEGDEEKAMIIYEKTYL